MVQVTGFDHIVLNVADVEVSATWYRNKLGLELVRMEEWRRGEVLFPSLRIDATTLIDLLATDRTGENLNHFAVVVDADDLQPIETVTRLALVAVAAFFGGVRLIDNCVLRP